MYYIYIYTHIHVYIYIYILCLGDRVGARAVGRPDVARVALVEVAGLGVDLDLEYSIV